MTDSEFLHLAEMTLDEIEKACEQVAVDIDASRTGNVLRLELADGSEVIINSQTPMRQLWVAARSGGFHFQQEAGRWRNTRDNTELFATLSRLLSEQSGKAVFLS